MAISSIGIGSGLDVESIVTQMVALEKSSIKTLELKAEVIESKISTYGQIQSLTGDLNDAARTLSLEGVWKQVKVSSSNSAVATTVTGSPAAGSYNVYVERLAQAQTSVTAKIAQGAAMGAEGSLSFNVPGADPITLNVSSSDTLQSLAKAITDNTALSKALSVSVVSDGQGNEQLMVHARESGLKGAFSMSVQFNDPQDQGLLPHLDFLPTTSQDPLIATGGQQAQDAAIKLNGVSMVSSTNTFSNVILGLTMTVSEEGKSSVITMTQDKDAAKDAIQKFVDSYNALNDLLSASTKYTQESKQAGILQGDSSAVSLQNALRMLTQSSIGNAAGGLKRLADVGIQMAQGGALQVNSIKLTSGLNDMDSLRSLFSERAVGLEQGGIAVRFKAYTDQLLAFEGAINTKTDSLEEQLRRNVSEVDKVESRAETMEARLRAQYSALDVKMASLNSLSSYVEQMVASWNKSKD